MIFFLLVDAGNDVSVTSDLEYDRFSDASDYFTYQDDPLAQSPMDEDAQLKSQFDEESSTGSADPPIYSGSKVTVSELAVAFLSLMLNNDISGELLGRFLSFVHLILPESNKFFSSLYSFLQYFKHLKTPVNFIYHCSTCFRKLENKDSVCLRCGKGQVNYYLNLPIILQIKTLYSNPKFVEALSYRFNRKKKCGK